MTFDSQYIMYSTIHVSKSWARPSLSPFSCVHGALRYSKKCKFHGNILAHLNSSSYTSKNEFFVWRHNYCNIFFFKFIVHCYAWRRRVNSSIIFQVVYITCETFIWRHYYYNWAFFVCVSFSKVIFSPSTCLAHGGMNLKKNAQNCEVNFSKKTRQKSCWFSRSASDLFIPESRQLGTTLFNRTYIQGLATTFLLIFGLISLLDLLFSEINLSNVLASAVQNDIKRRSRHPRHDLSDLDDLSEVVLRQL